MTALSSPIMLTPSQMLALCLDASDRAAKARSHANAVIMRARTIRQLAETISLQGDRPWPESAALLPEPDALGWS